MTFHSGISRRAFLAGTAGLGAGQQETNDEGRASLRLAAAIYLNFFLHHWLPDVRLGLFAATAVLFSPMMGVVIALAMIINIAIAGLAGVLVPVIFERLDQDPAVASSVFVTMITDSMGFFAFLGLAVAMGLATF